MYQYSPFGDNILFEGLNDKKEEAIILQEYIDHPRLGVQITGGARHNEAIAFARHMKAEFVKRGIQTLVFYRFSLDDNIHGHYADGVWREKMTPEYAAQWLIQIAQGGLIPSYNNEPTSGTLREIANHAEKVLRELIRLKAPPVLMLNWHSGFIPNLENYYGGEFDTVYGLMEQRGDYAGFHGYMNTRFYDNLDKPIYIGRHRYVTKKFPNLKIVYSEFGFDSHAPNPQVDGFRNHTTIWAKEFPNKSPIDVYYDESVKAEETILRHDNVIILFYCRYLNDTPRWTAFDFSEEKSFNLKKAKYRRIPVTQANKWANHNWGARISNVTASMTGVNNVRATPSQFGTRVDPQLKNGDTLDAYYDNPFNDGTYVWYKIIRGGRELFVTNLSDLRFNVTPPPVEDGNVILPIATLNQILDMTERMGTLTENIKNDSDELNTLRIELVKRFSGLMQG